MHMEEMTLSNQVRNNIHRIHLWNFCSTQIKPSFVTINTTVFCNGHAVRFKQDKTYILNIT